MILRRNKLPQVAVALFIGAAVVLFAVPLLRTRPEPIVTQASDAAPRRISRSEDLVAAMQQRLRRWPDDVDAYALLATGLLQRVRETGDAQYYAQAEQAVDAALRRDGQHLEALIAAGSLALARHDFARALEYGEQARALNPQVPRVYGVLVDALTELGRYDEAVAVAQTMVDMRPDLASYSRVAYLRELHGDLDGAAQALEAAVLAGGPTPENTEWTRVQLGNLELLRGNLSAAEAQYRRSLAYLPEYVPANAGLARIRAAQGRDREAIALLEDATRRMPLPEYIVTLGELYQRSGDRAAADRQYELVRQIDGLSNDNGVNTDLEIALFLADHGSPADAVERASAAYKQRPSIYAADVLGWSLLRAGRPGEAIAYAREALKLGTRDPRLLYHAGMIARANGDDDDARTWLDAAVALNPRFAVLDADEAAAALQELGGSATDAAPEHNRAP